jgi:16S rRNA G966 N2-methylase RsmD
MDGPYAGQAAIRSGVLPTSQTVGWRPTCDHNDDTGTCLVLDPFAGSGTVGAVARRFGRRFVGLDLSAPYLKLAQERIGAETMGMAL